MLFAVTVEAKGDPGGNGHHYGQTDNPGHHYGQNKHQQPAPTPAPNPAPAPGPGPATNPQPASGVSFAARLATRQAAGAETLTLPSNTVQIVPIALQPLPRFTELSQAEPVAPLRVEEWLLLLLLPALLAVWVIVFRRLALAAWRRARPRPRVATPVAA